MGQSRLKEVDYYNNNQKKNIIKMLIYLVHRTSSCKLPWHLWHSVHNLENLFSSVLSFSISFPKTCGSLLMQWKHNAFLAVPGRTALHPMHVSLFCVKFTKAPTLELTTAFERMWSPSNNNNKINKIFINLKALKWRSVLYKKSHLKCFSSSSIYEFKKNNCNFKIQYLKIRTIVLQN